MKNKFFILLIISQFFLFNFIYGDDFTFESSQIDLIDKGNIIKASGGVKALSSDGIEIISDEAIYDKKKSTLKAFGKVKIKEFNNKVEISADEIIYNKKLGTIISSKQNEQVLLTDKENNIEIFADKIKYEINENLISSYGNILANIENKFSISTEELIHDRNLMKVYSSEKAEIKDKLKNIIGIESFEIKINQKILKANKITLLDPQNNKYSLENSMVNLNTNEILGKDVKIDFDNSLFGNEKNEPRVRGKSVVYDENQTTIYKGTFTTCKKNKDKCPPWSIYADEVKHKKKEKIIEYKNAWLEIYDKPIVYFPYFYHPDPTVKRQSGFLMPKFINSTNSGLSLNLPYYKVISVNKDLTISPRIHFDDNIFLQTEYRQANKNSDFISDFSFNNKNSTTNSHFFSNIRGTLDNLFYEMNLQSISNDSYLKNHKIVSPLITNYSTLSSNFTVEKIEEYQSLMTSIEVYEDLSKDESDRYEFVFPYYKFSKIINPEDNLKGNLNLDSDGFQKIYDTNISETVIINDLKYSSNNKITLNGFSNKFDFLFRNVNSDANNSTTYKNQSSAELLSIFIYESKLPMIKKNNKSNSYLTPKISYRVSPNKTKNYSDLDRRINYDNIFSLDRIAKNNMVEGGQSITLGVEYSKKTASETDLLNFGIASSFRNSRNEDLPKKSTLGNKSSDLVGYASLTPNKFVDLNYEFSLDNDLEQLNYNFVKTNFKINNFITSFEFLEEDNFIGNKSYLKNVTKIDLNEGNSLSFETNKDLDKNITEYYNLIYEYKNDCLIAAVEYNKDFYKDSDVKPSENLFFSIKIIPFGSINAPGLKK